MERMVVIEVTIHELLTVLQFTCQCTCIIYTRGSHFAIGAKGHIFRHSVAVGQHLLLLFFCRARVVVNEHVHRMLVLVIFAPLVLCVAAFVGRGAL